MFPFILEDMSLVSQIYTMIQQFCPNRWIIVSPVESLACVEFKTYRFDKKRCRAGFAGTFSPYLSNLAGIRFDHFCLKEENASVMTS